MNNKKIHVLFIALLILAIILLYIGLNQKQKNPAKTSYIQASRLVQETVSKSANLVITIPDYLGINIAKAEDVIQFAPAIPGAWLKSNQKNQLIFKPKTSLEAGKYYSVIITSESKRIQSEFRAEEDPEIVAIFPVKNSEAPEDTEITIVFNRPMVPLTTLDSLDTSNIPIEIIPKTKGRFKWTSTRNLQFIPDERLTRSSNYTVRVDSSLTSVDGLALKEAYTHTFITRPLRYQSYESHYDIGLIHYNNPLKIYFNQPVNLKETKNRIRVTQNGKSISFIAEYGKRKEGGQEITDQSILEIYNKKDSNSRERFWDFDEEYNIEIQEAVPLEGDINLKEKRIIPISISNIISQIYAESDRSRHVEPNLFDPKGKLLVSFYEDIDLKKSKIEQKHIDKIEYGEKCKLDEEGYALGQVQDCEKETDYSKISITFKDWDYEYSEQTTIKFEKIINRDGLKLNAGEITKTLKVYPQLKIINTKPLQGSSGADLDKLILCTTTPLQTADEKTYKEKIQTDGPFWFNYWTTYKVPESPNQNRSCRAGQFENTIYYGLAPQTNYAFSFNLTDDFGQETTATLAFKTRLSRDKPKILY